MQVRLPYGKTAITIDAPPERVIASRLRELKPACSGRQLVAEAMRHPVAGPRLCELAKGKRNAVVIISDHTRPVPSRDILPLMLQELRQGNPNIDITLLVATGCHRQTNMQELEHKLGPEIVRQEKIVVHDAFCAQCSTQIGVLPSGAPLVIDTLAAETELLVAEGFIEPHFFAGFSGGRKSVLPGICSSATVLGNESYALQYINDVMNCKQL